jgi:hypothetical protein
MLPLSTPAARESIDHGPGAAQEHGDTARIGAVGGLKDVVGAQISVGRAVVQVQAWVATSRDAPADLVGLRGLTLGAVEEIHVSAHGVLIEGTQPAEERGDADTAGDPDLIPSAPALSDRLGDSDVEARRGERDSDRLGDPGV